MKASLRAIILSMVVLACCSSSNGSLVARAEYTGQHEMFKKYWGTELETHFDKLPTSGRVPKFRTPYAGYIYPDKVGGCGQVLRKYDYAFHRGRSLAASYEARDIASTKSDEKKRGGLFGLRMVTRRETPDWAGHCNGWTAAAIRHAEPQKSVIRNGVVFTPADIKGLLAELYVYSNSIMLGGDHGPVNPATLHLALTNWIGRGNHPFGMDISVGKEVWNYPAYGFSASCARRGSNRVEVRNNVGYVYMLNQEHHRAPKNYRYLRLHYMLYLNSKGQIVGGQYMADSDKVDLVWVPTKPTQGGTPGNQRGNPYLNVNTLLGMWRESVSPELRAQWWNVDPTEEDRIIVEEDPISDDQQLAEGDEATTETDEADVAGEPSEETEEPSDNSDSDNSDSDNSDSDNSDSDNSDSDNSDSDNSDADNNVADATAAEESSSDSVEEFEDESQLDLNFIFGYQQSVNEDAVAEINSVELLD